VDEKTGHVFLAGNVSGKQKTALAGFGVDIDSRNRIVVRGGYTQADGRDATIARDATQVDRRVLKNHRVEELFAHVQFIHTNERGGAVAGYSVGAGVRRSHVDGGGSARLYSETTVMPDGSQQTANYDLHGGTAAGLDGSIGFNIGSDGLLVASAAVERRHLNNGARQTAVSG